MVPSPQHSNCDNSPGLFDQCRTTAIVICWRHRKTLTHLLT